MFNRPSRQVFRVTPSYVAEQRNPVSTRHSFACVTSNPAASNHTTKPQVAQGVGVYPPPTPKARPLGIVPFSLGNSGDVSHHAPLAVSAPLDPPPSHRPTPSQRPLAAAIPQAVVRPQRRARSGRQTASARAIPQALVRPSAHAPARSGRPLAADLNPQARRPTGPWP